VESFYYILWIKNGVLNYQGCKDPNKYDEIQQYLDKVEKYRDQVMKITREYCDNQNTQKSTELDEVFSHYLKSCIRFIEMKELEEEPKYETEIEDTIFEHCSNMKSFWGKGAMKKKM
jgi:hypothetical protein